MSRPLRLGLAAMLAAALSFSATACSGGKDPAEGPVTLSYMVWDTNQVPVMKELAAAFTKEHPDITVDVQMTPWADYWTKLRASVSGGAAPDVFWMNGPNIQLYAANKVIMPLSDRISAAKIDLGAYPKALVDLHTFEGKVYGLPKDFDTVGVWYNKEIFDAAGVAYPKDGWTWADFKAAAAKLTNPAKGVFAVGANLSGQEYYYNTIYQAGGQVISADGKTSGYDQPATIEGLRFWTDLIKAGHSPDLKTMTDTQPLQLFESGKLAMYWGGSWNVSEFSKNEYTKTRVDVGPLPAGVKKATIIHGVANVVSTKTKHPEQAWQFVQFLGSRPAAEILGRSGPIPAYTGTQTAWASANARFQVQYLLDAVAYAVPYPISRNTAAWNEAEAKYLTQAYSGEVDVEAAAKALAKDMNALLAKE
ncbi:ABC transporter substrate-binding protein [Dactylosporangium sp. NPDC000521]|uniref:ABC transporter substrate-binding protein n=1 Tax=Dactylosporangium sp. NPDC000521 TaxID=3363975 RepID=UPI00369255D3